MIEIDAELDFAWQLDIRKSRAIPPRMFRDDLKRYASEVRKIAMDVFKHRGKQKQRKEGGSQFSFAWITVEDNGREYFKINRKHPLVLSIKKELQGKKNDLEKLLRVLEITLPVPAIVLNENLNADNPRDYSLPVNDDEMLVLVKSVYNILLKEGKTPEQARDALSYTEPFIDYPHLIDDLY
jgi:hypothetical protein